MLCCAPSLTRIVLKKSSGAEWPRTRSSAECLVQARKHIAIGAGEEISIKTGSASITTKKDGDVAIKGKDVNIEAAGKMTAKAAGEMVVKGSKISQN